ncbi:hypothetical protein ASF88_12685 [Leifsonia sp. Leaf336]|uniref:hypothetical protein n=1 Tax=Leifsonia sp. Leaf336 TaxID=1736341 RepID=UPI0006F39F50|nr:hypothetical protein [Leifsonia sp. Leaf336]KQR52392.1 hypothetical protein ASF88_12685 [Leifsonia sp. Leaf336]
MGWTTRNLTQRYGAPAAAGRPTAYLLATDGTRHVVYREAGPGLQPTGHLIEQYCGSDDVWHPKDITDEASGAIATSDPSGYAFDAEGSQHVVYLSGDDGHIHELYQADGWHANDLMDASGTVVRVVNPPMGWASKTHAVQQVVFRGDDPRGVHLLSRGTGDGATWSQQILTRLGGPTSASAPAGFAFDAAGTQHVHYVGDDQLIHEYTMDGSGWHYSGDLGVNVGAAHDSLPQPTGYGFAADGSRHVPWTGDDVDTHEASNAGAGWSTLNLTQDRGATPPARDLPPSGYAYESNAQAPVATRHVVYAGSDGIVYEFWNDPSGWHVNPLTGGEGSFPAGSAPIGYANPALGTQNVFYRSTTGDIVELRYTPGRLGSVNVHGLHTRAAL